MTALLTENLPLLAGAPNGIKKLRELILELAVRGKLVPQDPSDEPASELLKRIAEEKARLVAEGKIKKQRRQNEINTDEIPFELPAGWVWQRLGAVANIFNGNSINSTEKESKFTAVAGRPYISTKDVGYGLAPLDYENGVRIPDGEVAFRIAHAGAVLLCAEGGSAGKKCGITDRDIFFGNKLFATEAYGSIPPNLILYYFLTPTFRAAFGAVMTGIIGGVSIAKFVDLLVPLPPLTEQHRIVAKVDELMALCDRLEARQVDADSAHAQLVQALLDSLTQARDAEDFAKSWQRLAEHFHTLFISESSIDALQQTLLQLAVMGKLVPQDPSDEPASELLKLIAEEKERLVTTGHLKRQKPAANSKVLDMVAKLPNGWEYVSLSSVSTLITDGTHQTPKYVSSGRPFLSAQNVKPFQFMPEQHRFVSEEDFDSLRKNRVPELGDILMTRVGAMIGEAAVIDKEIDFAFYVSLALIKLPKKFCSAKFIALWLNSPLGTALSIKNTLGRGVSAGNLNLGLIRNFQFGFPPLAEQHRIVAKVEQLMVLCDQLKACLNQARQVHEQLASALVEQAVA